MPTTYFVKRFVSGHDLSRAVVDSIKLGALAPWRLDSAGAKAPTLILVSYGTTQSRALTQVITIHEMASNPIYVAVPILVPPKME